jgi:hypothetical protein
MGRLVTKEDPWHVHKTLGALALTHFAYRLGALAVHGSMLFGFGGGADAALVACHAALSLSSLIFRLPVRRHEHKPMIYPEFRAHSILFALRSVACCVLAMHGIGIWLRAAVCFLTMVAADAATARYASEGSTMRAMPFEGALTVSQRRAVTLYHSVSQANATALMVLRADAAFAPLLAIQLAAFLMTLVRKGLISTATWHVAYTASLAVCVFTLSGREQAWVGAVGIAFFVVRMRLGAPKYVVWCAIFATRPLAALHDLAWLDDHAHLMRVGYALAVVALALYGLAYRNAAARVKGRAEVNVCSPNEDFGGRDAPLGDTFQSAFKRGK